MKASTGPEADRAPSPVSTPSSTISFPTPPPPGSNYHVQMPVYSPEEVIHMIETVSADPKVKDELTAIIRRSAKLSEQRAALSLSITHICGFSGEQTALTGIGDESGYVVPEGISYDKSQNRYRTSYKEGKRLVQKVFSIRAHGEKKALGMAVAQRKQWIREGKVPIKGVRKESIKSDYNQPTPETRSSPATPAPSLLRSPLSSSMNHLGGGNRPANETFAKLPRNKPDPSDRMLIGSLIGGGSSEDIASTPMQILNSSSIPPPGDATSFVPPSHPPSTFDSPSTSVEGRSSEGESSVPNADMAFIFNTFGGGGDNRRAANGNMTSNGSTTSGTLNQSQSDSQSMQYLTNLTLGVATGAYGPPY